MPGSPSQRPMRSPSRCSRSQDLSGLTAPKRRVACGSWVDHTYACPGVEMLLAPHTCPLGSVVSSPSLRVGVRSFLGQVRQPAATCVRRHPPELEPLDPPAHKNPPSLVKTQPDRQTRSCAWPAARLDSGAVVARSEAVTCHDSWPMVRLVYISAFFFAFLEIFLN